MLLIFNSQVTCAKIMENKTHDKFCCGSPWFILKIVGMILLASIIIISILRERIVYVNERTMDFRGAGKVAYEPDTAKVNLGVQIDQKAKAEDALKELNEKIDKILKAVEATGIKKEDIQTYDYTLSPHYETIKEAERVIGYDANQVVAVKVKDIKNDKEKVSKVIAAASEAGVNQIKGISFEPSNFEDIKQEARLKAIADAKEKAKVLSKSLGVRLKRIVGWWENTYYPLSYNYSGEGMGGGGGMAVNDGYTPNVPSGAQELNTEVSITYRIK